MKKLILVLCAALALLSAPLSAQAPQPNVTISDTLYLADGTTPFTGTLTIQWPTFSIGSGRVAQESETVQVSNGALLVKLWYSDNVTVLSPDSGQLMPGFIYQIRGSSAQGPIIQFWMIQQAFANTTVNLASVRPSWIIGGSGGGTSSGFAGAYALHPAFSATPTFSLADATSKSPIRIQPGQMTANVTAVTFTGIPSQGGATFYIAWQQCSAGNCTVAYGGGVVNACQILATANSITTQEFQIDADGTTIHGINCGTDGPDNLVRTNTPNTFTSAGTVDLSAGTVAANFVLPTDPSYVNGHCAKLVATAGKFSLGDVSCGGGGGGMGGNIGNWWPFGLAEGSVNTESQSANTPRCWEVLLPFSGTPGRINAYQGAGATGRLGFALYDASGNLLTASTSTGHDATVTGPISVPLSSSPALVAGTFYLLCFASNETSSTFIVAANGNGNANTILQASATGNNSRWFDAANAISVSGTTITWPATLGNRTSAASNKDPIALVILP